MLQPSSKPESMRPPLKLNAILTGWAATFLALRDGRGGGEVKPRVTLVSTQLRWPLTKFPHYRSPPLPSSSGTDQEGRTRGNWVGGKWCARRLGYIHMYPSPRNPCRRETAQRGTPYAKMCLAGSEWRYFLVKTQMILPQVHLRKPCYDFSFLEMFRFK